MATITHVDIPRLAVHTVYVDDQYVCESNGAATVCCRDNKDTVQVGHGAKSKRGGATDGSLPRPPRPDEQVVVRRGGILEVSRTATHAALCRHPQVMHRLAGVQHRLLGEHGAQEHLSLNTSTSREEEQRR